MLKDHTASKRIITATELRRNFNVVVRRIHQKHEHTVIESKGAPVAVILSVEEYEKLVSRQNAKAAFRDLSHNFGRDIEKLGITEEEFMAELEKTKRRVFSEQYGRPA